MFRFARVFLAMTMTVSLCAGAAPATSPSALLADAAEKRDWTRTKTLLDQHADVNAAQVDGMTPLHWAAYHDNADMAILLIKSGANAKAANRYGVTPL